MKMKIKKQTILNVIRAYRKLHNIKNRYVPQFEKKEREENLAIAIIELEKE